MPAHVHVNVHARVPANVPVHVHAKLHAHGLTKVPAHVHVNVHARVPANLPAHVHAWLHAHGLTKGARSCTRQCTCTGSGKHACACACKAACTWAYNGTRACTCADDFHFAIPATNVQQSTVIITSMATYSSAYQLPARRICAGGVSDLACEPPSAVRIQLARWQAQVTQVWVVRSKTIDPTAHGGRPNTYDPRVTSA